jgi:hypothetical protein
LATQAAIAAFMPQFCQTVEQETLLRIALLDGAGYRLAGALTRRRAMCPPLQGPACRPACVNFLLETVPTRSLSNWGGIPERIDHVLWPTGHQVGDDGASFFHFMLLQDGARAKGPRFRRKDTFGKGLWLPA